MPQPSNIWHYYSYLLKMSKVFPLLGLFLLPFHIEETLSLSAALPRGPLEDLLFLSQIPCSTLSEDKVCAVWLSIDVLRLVFFKRCPDLILLCLIAPFDTATISSLIHSYTFLKFFTYFMCYFFSLPTFNSMLGHCNHSFVFSLISVVLVWCYTVPAFQITFFNFVSSQSLDSVTAYEHTTGSSTAIPTLCS